MWTHQAFCNIYVQNILKKHPCGKLGLLRPLQSSCPGDYGRPLSPPFPSLTRTLLATHMKGGPTLWLMLFCACWGWCIGSPIDWFASSVYCRGRDTNVGLCIQQQNKNICKVFWYTFSYKLLHTIQTGDLLKSIGQSKKCYYELKPVVYHSCTEWSMIEKNNR
jgi:hypothetical protein